MSVVAAWPLFSRMEMRIDNLSSSMRTVVATGWEPSGLSDAEVEDGEAYHRALYHSGDINQPANWHKESVDPLIKEAMDNISEGSLVVDYGTGTGGSAIELLKKLDECGVTIDLVLIDPLVSWFAKAREILGDREGVQFELSISKDEAGQIRFRRLEEMLGGRKADVIISSSTLHLVPAKAMDDLAIQFADSLSDDGVLIWDSGDLESDFRPINSALLHDPYRAVRDILRDNSQRIEVLSRLSNEEANKTEKRLDRIFPLPFTVEVIIDSMRDAGFTTQISERVVEFEKDDAERFVLVPRLAEIAAPLMKGEQRDNEIKKALELSLGRIADDGKGTDSSYRSHWIYGTHRLS
jgi:SAM-dependent methyltransferase